MHNLITTSTDLLRLITGSAADVDAVVSFLEYSNTTPPVVVEPGDTQYTTAITTATTTTILGAPSSGSKRRKIKAISIVNEHASASTTVKVVIERASGTWAIYNTVTLLPGESLTFTEDTGWFPNKNPVLAATGTVNWMTGSDLALSTTDVYMTNSSLKLDGLGAPTVGRYYLWRFILSKTAGTAAPVITVRTGTAGTTADTSRVVYTWGVGTSVADRAEIELEVGFTTVGSGSAAVLRGKANMSNNLTNSATGFTGTTPIHALQPADSGGFDSTAASLLIGLSFNGGTAFSGAMEFMVATTEQRG